jgi:hypothetical protein
MNRISQIGSWFLFALPAASWGLVFNRSAVLSKSKPGQVPPDTLITLERTPCYGTCPSYKLTISADGSVVFEGLRFVKKIGAAQSKISQDDVKNLIEKFDEIEYFKLRNRYQDPNDGCDEYVTDNPSANTSIRLNGKSKSVRHYYGCRGPQVLEALTKLEEAIDIAANTAQWLK